jgi:hypothetical protein
LLLAACGPGAIGGGTVDDDPQAAGARRRDALRPVPCAVLELLAEKCHSCHGSQPTNGAKVSLVHAEDFVRFSESAPEKQIKRVVRTRIASLADPMPPWPDARLGDGEIALLERWLDRSDGEILERSERCHDLESWRRKRKDVPAPAPACAPAPTILKTSCGGGRCHGAANDAGLVDLESAGVEERLRGPSTSALCGGRPLAPLAIEKLGGAPACGGPMPPAGHAIDGAAKECLEDWLRAFGP